MKVSLITRHAAINYGSLLQTIATQRSIESLGHECAVIDYVRGDEDIWTIEKTLLASKPEWNGSALRRFLYLAMRQPSSVIAGKRFKAERGRYLSLTRRYTSYDDLAGDPPEADVYMTGSDQVWGPVAGGVYDPAYMFGFAPGGARKVAYAASFGKNHLDSDAARAMRKYLASYDAISVREDIAVDQLREWGIPSEQVLDPTLLLGADEWRELSEESGVSSDGGSPYALIYQIHNDRLLSSYAQRAAEHLGLPLVRVSPYLHQISRSGKLRYLPSAGRFIDLLANASCLITDSFHGTAFATSFNVPFVEVLPDTGTTGRAMSLLRMTGLQGRVLADPDDIALASTPVDFGEANRVLAERRSRSLEVMRRLIEGC
ncbi:MAG TPA: polysaccharide pyruvyl transferase family protein [Collinsella ihuae]|uniref:Polysaccharide pyruvyl transferase family protein n=1 Tax=Collinsella ihumii TaxID=1720204 RepID=A0A921IR65_9ACTN|nr:polysaccharide pyruvyl transferase family protein [Collinsella ihumii]